MSRAIGAESKLSKAALLFVGSALQICEQNLATLEPVRENSIWWDDLLVKVRQNKCVSLVEVEEPHECKSI